MAQRSFSQLKFHDRVQIEALKREGLSLRAIGRRLGKSASTISRELQRNKTVTTARQGAEWLAAQNLWWEEDIQAYLSRLTPQQRKTTSTWTAKLAQDKRDWRRWRAKQKLQRKSKRTHRWVAARLRAGWSPDQIAGRSRVIGPESVSHEFVYQLVIRDRKQKGGLYRLLKRFGRRKQRVAQRQYPTELELQRRSIDERPPIVAERSRLGDCEADLIIGKDRSGGILTVVDRSSLYVKLRKLKTKQKAETSSQLIVALGHFGAVHTLTVDNGTEFFGHADVTAATSTPVYFCHPYCSTERGTVENTNGLIRHYLPKRTAFQGLTQRHLDKIAHALNHRPRKCHGYLTPHEVHVKQMPIRRASVALES